MILELIPEAQKLSSKSKRQLAEELLSAADLEEGSVSVDGPIAALLEQRLKEHAANPTAVSSWEEVRDRVFRPREN